VVLRLSRLSWAVAVASLASCAGEEADFTTFTAPGLSTKAPHTISVFGVFRDGRVSSRAWDELWPKLTGLLGPEPCSAAYSADLVTENSALASAIDDYSKNYGVTEPLLAELAPAAKGDLVLVVLIAGAVKSKGHDEGSRPRPAPGPGAMRLRRTTMYGRSTPRPDTAFEVTASLYSPEQRANVAAIGLRYGGASENEAISKLVARWQSLFPSTACAGWDFAGHPVDADTVRSLPEP
jgi:hypothetical protein